MTEIKLSNTFTIKEGARVTKDGVIKDVHFVGLKSKNVREGQTEGLNYQESALKEAVAQGVYNNLDVYTGHGNESDDERNPKDKIAVTANSVYKEGQGVFGDIQFNPKHPYFPAIQWWAENKPDRLGMSHVAISVFDKQSNSITKIVKALSVDIVSEPATTKGLFKEGVIKDKMEEQDDAQELYRIINTAYNLMCEQYFSIEKDLTDVGKAVNMLAVARDLTAELKAFQAEEQTESKKEKDMEWKDITLDDLKKNRPELVNAVEASAVKAVESLNTKVEERLKDIPSDKRTKTLVKLVRESVIKDDNETIDGLISDYKAAYQAPESTVAVSESVKNHETKSGVLSEADILAVITE